LHQKCVLPLAFANVVLSVAEVDAIVCFVEHREMQESTVRFSQRGELSILLFPEVVSRPETGEIETQME